MRKNLEKEWEDWENDDLTVKPNLPATKAQSNTLLHAWCSFIFFIYWLHKNAKTELRHFPTTQQNLSFKSKELVLTTSLCTLHKWQRQPCFKSNVVSCISGQLFCVVSVLISLLFLEDVCKKNSYKTLAVKQDLIPLPEKQKILSHMHHLLLIWQHFAIKWSQVNLKPKTTMAIN